MKNFVIAVLLAILITYSFGALLYEWTDVQLHVDDMMFTPFDTLVGMGIAGVVLIIIGFVIAVSLFGAMFLAVGAVFIGLLVAGLSIFWPMLLVLAIVVWLVRDKRRQHYE